MLFGCLALLLAGGNIKVFKLPLILNMVVLAAGTEFLQIFIPGRCPPMEVTLNDIEN